MKIWFGLLLVAFSANTLVSADETLISSANRPKPTTEFMGQRFNLAFVNESENQGHVQILNEYIPDGESLDKWTKMIAVFHYPKIVEVGSMPQQLVKLLTESNPLARYAIHSSEDGKRIMVDFVTWDLEAEITEFNVFIYQLAKTEPGVIVQQYAARAYGTDAGQQLLIDLKQKRMPTIDAVTKYDFPAITAEPVK